MILDDTDDLDSVVAENLDRRKESFDPPTT
jgi:hypothetical protein